MFSERRDQILDRLEREKDEILDYLRNNAVALGDGSAVVYDKEFADKSGISQFGKMTYEDTGRFNFHATPIKFDREPKYDMPEKNFLSFADSYADGRECSLTSRDLFALPDQPKLKSQGVPYRWHDKAERNLLTHLSKRKDLVCLVNPSYSSLWHLIDAGGGLVYIHSREDKKWVQDIRDFCQQHATLRFVLYLPENVVCYLGTNSPEYIPDRDYVYLCPNPYSMSLPFEVFSIQEYPTGVEFQYRTKKHRTSFLSDVSGEFIYNPATLTEVGKADPYFLCSSFDLEIEEKEMRTVYHTPFFLDDLPEYVEEGGLFVSRLGTVVYDIQGPGTYISRRSRIPLRLGDSWAPFVPQGEWVVTRSTNTPYRSSVQVDRSLHGSTVIMLSRTPDAVRFVEYTDQPLGWYLDEEGSTYTLSGKKISRNPLGMPVLRMVATREGYEALDHVKTVAYVFQPCTTSSEQKIYEVPVVSLEEELLVFADSSIFRGDVYVFFDKSQLETCRLWSVMYGERWSNLFSERQVLNYPRVSKPPDLITSWVTSFLRQKPVDNWQSSVASYQDLVSSSGSLRISRDTLLSLLVPKRGVLRWFGGFTVLSSVKIMMPGDIVAVEGKLGNGVDRAKFTINASGNSVRSLFELLTNRSRTVLRLEMIPESMLLLRFLEDNGLLICRARRKIEGRYFLYQVYSSAWAPLKL